MKALKTFVAVFIVILLPFRLGEWFLKLIDGGPSSPLLLGIFFLIAWFLAGVLSKYLMPENKPAHALFVGFPFIPYLVLTYAAFLIPGGLPAWLSTYWTGYLAPLIMLGFEPAADPAGAYAPLPVLLGAVLMAGAYYAGRKTLGKKFYAYLDYLEKRDLPR